MLLVWRLMGRGACDVVLLRCRYPDRGCALGCMWPDSYVQVDEFQNTSTEGVYALGDVCGNHELTPVRARCATAVPRVGALTRAHV